LPFSIKGCNLQNTRWDLLAGELQAFPQDDEPSWDTSDGEFIYSWCQFCIEAFLLSKLTVGCACCWSKTPEGKQQFTCAMVRCLDGFANAAVLLQ